MAKVTQPFFTPDATGTIPGIGTVTRRTGKPSIIAMNSGGNPAPLKDTPAERAGFAAARAAWLAIVPTRYHSASGWRYARFPRWAAFAATWYAVNNSWVH